MIGSSEPHVLQFIRICVASVAISKGISVDVDSFVTIFHDEEHVSDEGLESATTPQSAFLMMYLGSNGRRRSGKPASFSFCLTQSINQDGLTMFVCPTFCNEATLTVPGVY